MMFNSFEEMCNFYKRRNIFNYNDFSMLEKGVVQDATDFWNRIVRPKLFLGRLNHGDAIRIANIIFG